MKKLLLLTRLFLPIILFLCPAIASADSAGLSFYNAGANQIPSTPAAGTTITLTDISAPYTQSAAITGSANNVRILCAPGVVVQFTGATSGFNITGNGWYIDPNCTFDHASNVNSGTGPLFTVSGNDNTIQGYVQNTGTTNPASSTILITGGSRNKVLGVRFLGTQADSCIGLVPTAEIFDALVQDNVVPTFNPGTASLSCIFASSNSGSASTSQVRTSIIHNTITGQGSNAALINYTDQSVAVVATTQNPHIDENILTATGSLNDLLKTFVIRSGTVNGNIVNDGGFAVLDMLHQGDFYNSAAIGNSLNSTSNNSGGINCTDCSRSTFQGNTAKGIGNTFTGLFIGTAANPSISNTVTGNSVTLGGSGTCYQFQANGTSDPVSDNNSAGNTCTGTGAANQFCWTVTDTLGGAVGNVSNGDTCANVTHGFTVGAGATGTRIINPTFDTVTAANAYALSAATTIVDMNGVLFANIPSNLANGSMLYVSDGTIANPMASGGTGAILKQLNGVHVGN